MRKKYIEDKFPHWFNHGGTLIAFNTEREFCTDEELPQQVINEHNKTVDKLIECVLFLFALDSEQANKFWYKK